MICSRPFTRAVSSPSPPHAHLHGVFGHGGLPLSARQRLCAAGVCPEHRRNHRHGGRQDHHFLPVPAVQTAAGDGAGGGEPAAAGHPPDPAPHDGLGRTGQPPPAAGGAESGQGVGEHRNADRGCLDGTGPDAGRATRHHRSAREAAKEIARLEKQARSER